MNFFRRRNNPEKFDFEKAESLDRDELLEELKKTHDKLSKFEQSREKTNKRNKALLLSGLGIGKELVQRIYRLKNITKSFQKLWDALEAYNRSSKEDKQFPNEELRDFSASILSRLISRGFFSYVSALLTSLISFATLYLFYKQNQISSQQNEMISFQTESSNFEKIDRLESKLFSIRNLESDLLSILDSYHDFNSINFPVEYRFETDEKNTGESVNYRLKVCSENKSDCLEQDILDLIQKLTLEQPNKSPNWESFLIIINYLKNIAIVHRDTLNISQLIQDNPPDNYYLPDVLNTAIGLCFTHKY